MKELGQNFNKLILIANYNIIKYREKIMKFISNNKYLPLLSRNSNLKFEIFLCNIYMGGGTLLVIIITIIKCLL